MDDDYDGKDYNKFLVCFVKWVLGIITYALHIANSYAALL